MIIKETIYTQKKLLDTVVYYGDIPTGSIPVLTLTGEKKLNWFWRKWIGCTYSYTLTITDE